MAWLGGEMVCWSGVYLAEDMTMGFWRYLSLSSLHDPARWHCPDINSGRLQGSGEREHEREHQP